MLKKTLGICSICVISALFASECLALDTMPKAISGEVSCIGGDGSASWGTTITNFVFRNLDAVRSISFTKIRLYTESGQLVASLTPPNFPASFRETIGPSATAALNSTQLLNGNSGGRLTLKITFKTTDGIAAIAPHGMSGQIDLATNGDLISRDTVDCVYTTLK